ncbi:MAG: alanine racemase [Treponema sp.]|jgi:alanine racemase|nr:alanine racemase [Treponema sp.]
MRATQAVVHLDRFRKNITLIQEKIGNCRMLAPVKADAYGHGAVALARAALDTGCFYLAVATTAEGAELRYAGIDAPILLLSLPLPEELDTVVSLNLTPLIGDTEFASLLAHAATGRRLSVHLKIDMGMGRLGCRPEDAVSLARFVDSSPHLDITGTATHLEISDSLNPSDVEYTLRQIEKFQHVVESIRKDGIHPGVVHAASSAGILLYAEAYFEMVRPGILLYGYMPSSALKNFPVEPVMELKSNIVFIKKVKKGESISYGKTWTASEDTTVGTVPIGYGDGLPRLVSNRHAILIHGKRYPLVGRICMDQCMVDMGRDSSIERWEEVTIFGAKPALSVADIADIVGTIPYEITCNINKRVPRVYR